MIENIVQILFFFSKNIIRVGNFECLSHKGFVAAMAFGFGHDG